MASIERSRRPCQQLSVKINREDGIEREQSTRRHDKYEWLVETLTGAQRKCLDQFFDFACRELIDGRVICSDGVGVAVGDNSLNPTFASCSGDADAHASLESSHG